MYKNLRKIIEIYKKWPIQVRASFIFLMCSFLQKGISFITTPIFTRVLSTTEYGQFTVFISWMNIITPIISLNLYSGVYSQGVVKFEKDRNRYSSSLQGLSLTLILIWLSIYLVFRNQFNELFSLTTVQMVAMFVIIWASGSFNFWSMNQRVDFQYRKLAILTMAVSVFQPFLCVLLILNSTDKVTARILGMASIQFLFYIGTFISQIRKGKQLFVREYWKYALCFNIPLLPHYLSLTVLSSSDRIMISSIVSEEKAGIYNLAYSVSMIMTMFNTSLLQTIEPWIYRKLKEKRVVDLARVAYPCFLLIAGVNILLILFAPEIITIFAPKAYYEAIWVIPSCALSVFFMFLYSFFATFEFYYEKTKYVAMATVGGALLNIILNYVCIKQFGYLAAGYTTLFSYILFAILHYIFMRKVCKEFLNNENPYNGRLILAIGVGSVVIGLSCMIFYKYIVIRYLIITIIIFVAWVFRNKVMLIVKTFLHLRKEKE